MTPLVRLGDFTRGRDNNIQLLRLLAAAAVMLFHSYVFAGRLHDEPLTRVTGTTNFGVLGVECFFVLSGFLITRSWLERPRLREFAAARALRIYPALLLAVALSIALAGGSSAVPWRAFLASPVTIDYAWNNALAWEVKYVLPGAFPHNAVPGGANGSLWTLPVELRLYIGVALAGLAGLLGGTWRWCAVVAALVALFVWKPEWVPLRPNDPPARDVALLFGLGSLAYVARDRLPLSLVALAAGVALCLALPLGTLRVIASTLALAYGVLVLAYHPRLRWSAYNRVGDYSYGLYLFAFPVQQTIIGRWPGLSAAELFAWSFAATLALAAASWHGVEKPMLARKARFRDGE